VITNVPAAWTRYTWIVYVPIADTLHIWSNEAQTFYVDDVSVIELDDVSITATAASEANSAEGTGIRVDGLDTLTQSISGFALGSWQAIWPYTPRHDDDNEDFGVTDVTCGVVGVDGTEYVHVRTNGDTNFEIYEKENNEAGTPFDPGFTAGAKVTCKLKWDGAVFTFSVDGVDKGTLTPTSAITYTPNVFRADLFGVQPADAVIG
jgi:hypothetical protein